jgi:hypothetical protein
MLEHSCHGAVNVAFKMFYLGLEVCRVPQAVECLLCEWEALSSNTSLTEKENPNNNKTFYVFHCGHSLCKLATFVLWIRRTLIVVTSGFHFYRRFSNSRLLLCEWENFGPDNLTNNESCVYLPPRKPLLEPRQHS